MASKVLLLLVPLIIGLFPGEGWKPDTAKAKIMFSVKGPFGIVHGNFSGLKASINFNEKDPAAGSFSASIDVKTISTGISLRNTDLRDKELWFNAGKYPQINFKSKKIEKTKDGYMVNGDLTLKGVTKLVSIPFQFTQKGAAGIFKGQFTLKRQDYHLGKEGGSVGNIVTIDLELPVTK